MRNDNGVKIPVGRTPTRHEIQFAAERWHLIDLCLEAGAARFQAFPRAAWQEVLRNATTEQLKAIRNGFVAEPDVDDDEVVIESPENDDELVGEVEILAPDSAFIC
jgi:hypothetical protein